MCIRDRYCSAARFHERASAERQPLFTISFKLCHRKADALFQLPVEFFHARGLLPLLSLRALSGSDVFRRGKDGHAAPLQPPPAPAGFKEAARRRTACETFERFLPPQLKTPSLPYFHDSRIDVPIVPSGIFTPKFSATDAPITAKVSFVS